MPIATHPETGETVFLDGDGAWKPAQTAVNPQTKQLLAHDGNSWVAVPAKSKGVLGYIDDAVRSLASGATFGFADEIAAKGNELIGRGTYDQNVKDERAKDAAIPGAIKYPGEIAGAIAALPVGGIVRGAGMGARALQSAKVGGIYGALSGAGAGENPTERATGAAVGLGAGAALGGAAVPVVEGVIQGGRALAGPLVNSVRGAINPADEGSRRVVTALQRDIKSDPNAVSRLTPAEFGASVSEGGPATVMDMGGETTRALARSAANTSPEGRQVLNNTINDRFEGQTGRLTGWLNKTFNFPDAAAQREAIDTVAKSVNTPAYARAMKDGSHGVWNPELQRLAGAPAIQDAAASSVPSLANRGITEGFRAPRQNPLTIDGETGLANLTQTANGNSIFPDLRFWDQVKRGLDSAVSKAEKNQDTAKVQELTGLRAQLVKTLDESVPSYQQARQGAAHFFGAEDALQAGQNFVAKNFESPAARRALSNMTPTERQLFQDGFVSRYVETLEKTGDRRNVLNQITDSPAAREKVNIALGPQKATELEAKLRVEGIMDLARGAVQGNSTTARQLAELGFAGGAGSLGAHGAYSMDPKEMGVAAVAGALLAGKHGIDSRVAQQVAKMLVSQDAGMVQRGIDVISKNSRFMDALRIADRKVAAAGSEQVPTRAVPALQGPSVSSASDYQDIPGMPSQ